MVENEYIYNIYNNNNNNNNKIASCILVSRDVKLAAKHFACSLGISWSELISKALIEYMRGHKEEAKRPLNITVTLQAPKKPLIHKCQIGDCKSPAVSTGQLLETKKEYRLCAAHANLYRKDREVSKLWKVN